MPLIRSRECLACGRQFDLLEHPPGELSNLDRADIDDLSCPDCDHLEAKPIVSCGQAVFTGGAAGVGKHYPYYSDTFGCEVQSNRHHLQLCRQHGLNRLDEGMGTVIDNAKKRVAKMEEFRRRGEELMDMYNNRPDFADYRRLRDKGYFEDRKRAILGDE
jgi:hypothetical protein